MLDRLVALLGHLVINNYFKEELSGSGAATDEAKDDGPRVTKYFARLSASMYFGVADAKLTTPDKLQCLDVGPMTE
jgi:hypothetical protein